MPKASYQYGTSPRKYEPNYNTPKKANKNKKKVVVKKTLAKKEIKKSNNVKKVENQKSKKVECGKNRTLQVIVVLLVFGMLLALSYREITIMEMFNQKKNLEKQLSIINKENGQVEKNIREEESKLNWNEVQQIATEQLGMQAKTAIPVDLEKKDSVETVNEFIQKEEENIIEKIIEYFIKK